MGIGGWQIFDDADHCLVNFWTGDKNYTLFLSDLCGPANAIIYIISHAYVFVFCYSRSEFKDFFFLKYLKKIYVCRLFQFKIMNILI